MHKKYYTLAEIAELTQSKLIGDPDYLISNVSDLQTADTEDASFLANPNYEQAMKRSKAGVVFINEPFEELENRNFLVTNDPSRAFQTLLEMFHENIVKLSGFSTIHPSAIIHEKSTIGNNVSIGPLAVIDQNAKIGNNSSIGAGCYIGPGVYIGEHTLIHANVTIRELCFIGNRVVLHPGVVIGSCGFGYVTDENGHHHKLCQVGIVTIEDDVEIGANSTVDRSRFKSTTIKRGTKIDNLVQIAHGVTIGQDCIVVAQTGIAGSTEIGDHVVLGGQVGVAGHIKICSNVAIGAKSGVSKSIIKPGNYRGIPAIPILEFNRIAVHTRNIDKFIDRLKEVESKIYSSQERRNLSRVN